MSGLKKIVSVFALKGDGKGGDSIHIQGQPKPKQAPAVLRKKPPPAVRNSNISSNHRRPEPSHSVYYPELQGHFQIYDGQPYVLCRSRGNWGHPHTQLRAMNYNDMSVIAEARRSEQMEAHRSAFQIPRKPVADSRRQFAQPSLETSEPERNGSSPHYQNPARAVQEGPLRQSRYYITNPDLIIAEADPPSDMQQSQSSGSHLDETIHAGNEPRQLTQSDLDLRVPEALSDEESEIEIQGVNNAGETSVGPRNLATSSNDPASSVDGPLTRATDETAHVTPLKLKGKEKKTISGSDHLVPSENDTSVLQREIKKSTEEDSLGKLMEECNSLREKHELLSRQCESLWKQDEVLRKRYQSLQAMKDSNWSRPTYELSRKQYEASRRRYQRSRNEYISLGEEYDRLSQDYEKSTQADESSGRASRSDQHVCGNGHLSTEQYPSNPFEDPPEDEDLSPFAPNLSGGHARASSSIAPGEVLDNHSSTLLQKSQDSPPKRRDCIVCGDSISVLDFPAKPPSTSCTHPPQTCTSCLQSWMTSEIETKGTSGEIKCPECPSTLTYHDIQLAASPAAFTTYDTLTARAALGDLGDFSWCLAAGCSSGQENPPKANFMRCLACGYEQCLSHRTPWHDGETCGEHDYRVSGQQARDEAEARKLEAERKARKQREEEEKKTAAMIDGVSKACPNPKGCGWRIQKADGCDHMTCRRCRWEFCWLCLAGQKEIRRVGNTAHAVGCRYHSRNLQVAYPFNAH